MRTDIAKCRKKRITRNATYRAAIAAKNLVGTPVPKNLSEIPLPTNLGGKPVHPNIVGTDVPLNSVETVVPFSPWNQLFNQHLW